MSSGLKRTYASGAVKPRAKVVAMCHTCETVEVTLKVPRAGDQERNLKLTADLANAALAARHSGHVTELEVVS